MGPALSLLLELGVVESRRNARGWRPVLPELLTAQPWRRNRVGGPFPLCDSPK
jgi:hypothetical protein